MFFSFNWGVEFLFPEIFNSLNWNPAVCKIDTTTESISSAASLSIPVTSIKIFLVFGVTVVNAELIIGGKDIVFFSESKIIGTFFVFSITEP